MEGEDAAQTAPQVGAGQPRLGGEGGLAKGASIGKVQSCKKETTGKGIQVRSSLAGTARRLEMALHGGERVEPIAYNEVAQTARTVGAGAFER